MENPFFVLWKIKTIDQRVLLLHQTSVYNTNKTFRLVKKNLSILNYTSTRKNVVWNDDILTKQEL